MSGKLQCSPGFNHGVVETIAMCTAGIVQLVLFSYLINFICL